MPRYARKTKTVTKTKKVAYKPKVPRPVFKANVQLGKGLPKKMTMIHKYVERGTMQNTTGAPSTIATQEYYTNNLFRVNKTSGSTHQPLYFDQMMLIYNTFTVIGSKFKVTFMRPEVASAVGASSVVGVFINDKIGAIVPVVTSTMAEQTGSKNSIVRTDTASITKTMTWSAKKRIGGSVLGNNDLSGSNTASPVETNTYVMWQQDFAKTTASSVNFNVEIEYIAVWSGLRDIAGS